MRGGVNVQANDVFRLVACLANHALQVLDGELQLCLHVVCARCAVFVYGCLSGTVKGALYRFHFYSLCVVSFILPFPGVDDSFFHVTLSLFISLHMRGMMGSKVSIREKDRP